MIEFQNLKVSACPTCKCKVVVRESIEVSSYKAPLEIRQHCNGERWESRKFLCGCSVTWCPNFSRPEITTPCPRHPEILKLEAEKEALSKKEAAIREAQSKLREREDAVRRSLRANP